MRKCILSLDPKKTYIPDASDEPFNGILREWYNGREVVSYKLTAISPVIVEKWADLVLETIADWPKNKPYLAIHDLSQPGVSLQYAALVKFDMMNIGINDDGRIRAEVEFDKNPNWMGRVAVNFNLSLSGQTNRTLMNFLDKTHPAISYKSFYNRTKSLRWLTTGITDTSEMRAIEDLD